MDMFSDGHVLCFSSIGIRFIYSNLFFFIFIPEKRHRKKKWNKKDIRLSVFRDGTKINKENVYSFVHLKINGVNIFAIWVSFALDLGEYIMFIYNTCLSFIKFARSYCDTEMHRCKLSFPSIAVFNIYW